MASKKRKFDPVAFAVKAAAVRDLALAEYREVRDNPDAYDGCDPGDAEVTLDGNGHNVLRVLNFLRMLGLPGCDP